MRLIPLHNALLLLQNTLHARAAATKLLPVASKVPWPAAEVAVGDIAGLVEAGWVEGKVPQPSAVGVEHDVFGLSNATLYRQSDGLWLCRVAISEDLLTALPSQFRFDDKREQPRVELGELWLAVVVDTPLNILTDEGELNPQAEGLIGVAVQSLWRLYQSEQLHRDPVTGLAGASELRHKLQQVGGELKYSEESLGLYLFGPRDYAQLRRDLGQEATEEFLQRSALALKQALRKTDRLFCYREGQFAAVLHVQDRVAGNLVAEKIYASVEALVAETGRPCAEFAMGYLLQSGEELTSVEPQTLCLSAEQALERARVGSTGTNVCFAAELDTEELHAGQVVSFPVADPVKEHRNHRILWQTVSLVAANLTFDELANQFVTMLRSALDNERVELLELDKDALNSVTALDVAQLAPAQQRLVRRAIAEQRTLIETGPDNCWLAAVMLCEDLCACLLIGCENGFDASDQVFFKSIAGQLAGALARDKQTQQAMDQSAAENRALRSRLNNLQHHQLISQVGESDAMREVLEFVGRIAPTDVSVLITGESGAGKEVMARSIHEQSQRAHAPLVTVDCGAIAHSLIDSELFGRVKGAFTGADEASIGRIAEAQGGTLFLDEIGELPLDVQSKLLRFVQEREFVAVGDTRPQYIDSRILCATNRDLLSEVEAGRFRADLYYRLQVIQVVVPPLRERLADLKPLTYALLEVLTQQFNQPLKTLSQEAFDKIAAHRWPGNVRELQNTLMRALLTAQGTRIEAHDLQLSTELRRPLPTSAVEQPTAEVSAGADQVDQVAAGRFAALGELEDPWLALSLMLREQIDALISDHLTDAPIGRWLNDALILTAHEFAGDVIRNTAQLLSIAETTLRRQLGKAKQNEQNPLYVTASVWELGLPRIRAVLVRILKQGIDTEGLANHVERVLMQQIVRAVGCVDARGAALMGITKPTYQRRRQKYQLAGDFDFANDLDIAGGIADAI